MSDLSGISLIGMIWGDMPKKRRKAINTQTTPDIPFQKVRVEWVDCVSDSAWASDKDFEKMNEGRVCDVLIAHNDTYE